MFESSLNNPYLIESYTNGQNWYRIYSDGWIEQGGFSSGNSSWSTKNINFLKPFNSTNYTVLTSRYGTISTGDTSTLSVRALESSVSINNKSTTSFQVGTYYNLIWEACGYKG